MIPKFCLLKLRAEKEKKKDFLITLSQMTNFRLFQTERVCRQQFQV